MTAIAWAIVLAALIIHGAITDGQTGYAEARLLAVAATMAICILCLTTLLELYLK